jgi:hypothetical protein
MQAAVDADPELSLSEYLMAVGILLHVAETVNGVQRSPIVHAGRRAAADVTPRVLAHKALEAAKRAR